MTFNGQYERTMTMANINDKIDNGITIKTTRSCRNSSGGSTNLTITVDYSGCTIKEVLDWATSSRIISGQRVWATMSDKQLLDTVNDTVVLAANIGKKPADIERAAQSFEMLFANMSQEQQAEYLTRLMEQAKK